jgi:hypothetical protein
MLTDIINRSFLLNESQKIYLIERLKTANDSYIQSVMWIMEEEENLMLLLLKKYKEDNKNHSIWQLKWELMAKNLEKIRNLEEEDDDFFDIYKESKLN